MRVKYELIEHTADIGIKVKAQSLKELFSFSAAAMFDLAAKKKPILVYDFSVPQTIDINQNADNLEELFISWLNELLSLSATEGLIFTQFEIDGIIGNTLHAGVVGEDISKFAIKTEIKAATYHELSIEQIDEQYIAKVIFDV